MASFLGCRKMVGKSLGRVINGLGLLNDRTVAFALRRNYESTSSGRRVTKLRYESTISRMQLVSL